jgi:hypothetical protein
MKRLALALSVAALAVLAIAATVSAAGPPATQQRTQARDADTLPTMLGLTRAQVAELRQDGRSLAQIAEQQKVDPQKLIDALVAQWTVRIDARVAAGALTADQATALKEQLALRAKAMVNQATPGGMRGVAVGAGPGAANGAGPGTQSGAGRGAMNGAGPTNDADGTGRGAGRGAMGAGRGAGTGTCDGSGPNGPTS